MVLIVDPKNVETVQRRLAAAGEPCFPLGEIVAGDRTVEIL